jgi:hypothetical protein
MIRGSLCKICGFSFAKSLHPLHSSSVFTLGGGGGGGGGKVQVPPGCCLLARSNGQKDPLKCFKKCDICKSKRNYLGSVVIFTAPE